MSLFHPIRDPVVGTAHVVGVSAVDPQFMRQINTGAASQPAADPLDRIAKLAQLHKDGALTDGEFASMKAKILEQPA